MVVFLLSGYFGRGPISPAAVWVPNRILAFITLPASCGVALLIQRQRLDVTRAQDQAMGEAEETSGAVGTGLGLRLCKSLIGRAGGSLVVDVRDPNATAIELRLPVTEAPESG
jgi:signal transduction histidine kinase